MDLRHRQETLQAQRLRLLVNRFHSDVSSEVIEASGRPLPISRTPKTSHPEHAETSGGE